MKSLAIRSLTALCSASLCLVVLAAPRAEDVVFDGSKEGEALFPNLRVGGGITLLHDASVDGFASYVEGVEDAFGWGSGDMSFDPGPSLTVALGGRMPTPRWLHLEVETGVSVNSLELTTEWAQATGDLWQIPAVVNAAVPFSVSPRFEVLGGAGIGAMFGVMDLSSGKVTGGSLDGSALVLDNPEFTAAALVQLFGGVRYRLTQRSGISLDYRFRGTTPPQWSDDDVYLDLDRLFSHTLSVAYELKW